MKIDETTPIFSQKIEQQALNLINNNYYPLLQLNEIVEKCIQRIEFLKGSELDAQIKNNVHRYFEANYLEQVHLLFIDIYTKKNEKKALSNIKPVLKEFNELLGKKALKENWPSIIAKDFMNVESAKKERLNRNLIDAYYNL